MANQLGQVRLAARPIINVVYGGAREIKGEVVAGVSQKLAGGGRAEKANADRRNAGKKGDQKKPGATSGEGNIWSSS